MDERCCEACVTPRGHQRETSVYASLLLGLPLRYWNSWSHDALFFLFWLPTCSMFLFCNVGDAVVCLEMLMAFCLWFSCKLNVMQFVCHANGRIHELMVPWCMFFICLFDQYLNFYVGDAVCCLVMLIAFLWFRDCYADYLSCNSRICDT